MPLRDIGRTLQGRFLNYYLSIKGCAEFNIFSLFLGANNNGRTGTIAGQAHNNGSASFDLLTA